MSNTVPIHVAIVMDGNGRWATSQKLPRIKGHEAGMRRVQEIIQASIDAGVRYLSLYVFSKENWARPIEEVRGLMQLFMKGLQHEVEALHHSGVHLNFLGDIEAFSSELQIEIAKAQKLTQHNDKLTVNFMVNYSGQWDILQALKHIVKTVPASEVNSLSFDAISSSLVTAGIPDPDLLIRTSSEQRISNYFLWQLAYSELYFCDTLWPDFDKAQFYKALQSYQSRERRFGQISAQLKGHHA